MEKVVLQKFIADSGLCSRRKAEDLIRIGKVKINGHVAELGMKAGEEDEVIVDGNKIIINNRKIYIKLNKPAGYTCTNRKFKGEKNIFELVDLKERLFAVGRLDKDSRGLVLLTNDGELTNKLTHPRYGHEKEYIVEVECSKLKVESIVKQIEQGVDVGEGDGIAKARDIKYLGDNKFKIVLGQGKKRQIRRMFKALGCDVIDLLRIRIGKFELEDLKEGEWEYINVN
ncbi:MAG: pseudouridine synthase [Patescibacteria group bacterium]|jgi:pseudouridine synthase